MTMRSRNLAITIALALLVSCTSGAGEEPAASTGQANASPVSDTVVAGSPGGTAFESACGLSRSVLQTLRRGYFAGRSPEIVTVPRAPNFFGSFTATTHSGPWDYLQEVPLALYGPGFIQSYGDLTLDRPVTLADLAPTLAELVDMPWPRDRPGRPLTEALVPEDSRPSPTPSVIVVVVWDGGGWNVLNRWPDQWPVLAGLMDEGTSVQGVRVGSSPSVTPAIHATIGTGAFPKQHGIVDILLRDGESVAGSWDEQSPTYLQVPTLADLYDFDTDNRAEIGMVAEKGWHLGMIGRGAAMEGGDKDHAVMGDIPGRLYTNPDLYSLPSYLQEVEGYDDDVRTVDLSDGRIDSSWQGHEMLDDPEEARLTPVFSLYQNRLIKELFEREGYGDDAVTDLFFTNYKQMDLIGHAWNMTEPEESDAIRYSDEALGDLVVYLNAEVGADEWVMVVTADHGQTPLASTNGAWPIDVNEMGNDAASKFSLESPELIQAQRPSAMWLNSRVVKEADISYKEISEFLLDYTVGDNVSDDATVPAEYEDRMSEPVFEAAFPYTWMPQVWDCALTRS